MNVALNSFQGRKIMAKLFSYNTLNISALVKEKALLIEIDSDTNNNRITSEVLFELDSLMNWCSEHLEVVSLFITSSQKYSVFSYGPSENLEQLEFAQLKRYYYQAKSIINKMLSLPQTIVLDYRSGAQNIAIDLGLGADIRLGNEDCSLHFNYGQLGIPAIFGSINHYRQIIPLSFLKSWMSSNCPVSFKTLIRSGFLMDNLEDTSDKLELLMRIKETSTITRVQTKKTFNDLTLLNHEQFDKIECQNELAILGIEDWKGTKHSTEDIKRKAQNHLEI
jgi:enoyl-CoA hydratase/carnithine racemase